MKTKMMIGIGLLVVMAAVAAWSAGNGSVKVTAPGPAKVYIDDKPVTGTIALPEGSHTIKVFKEGQTSGLMRTVVVKPNATVEVDVNFEKKAIDVKNPKALGYPATEGETKTVIGAPKESEAPAEKPGAAAGAEPDKGKPGPGESPAPHPGAPKEWSPEPTENEVGPPPPPGKDKHPAAGPTEKPGTAPEIKPGSTTEKKPEPCEIKPETKKEPLAGSTASKKPAVAPCKLKGGADTCAYYGGRDDVRETLFTYYCNLANHDLDAAYKYWSADQTRDLGWFYENSGNFCKVDDYRIQNLDIVKSGETQAKVTYTLELIDGRGQVMEIRKMSASLTRKSDVWSIKTNTRETVSTAKPPAAKTPAKPPAPKKPITKPTAAKCPVPNPETAKPKEPASGETKTTETKTTETKPAATKPTETKTTATKPTAPKTPAAKPKDAKAPATKTTVTKTPEPKPEPTAEPKPAPKPVESAPMPSPPPTAPAPPHP